MACVVLIRPYTMVFVGINGVGKSTSLSKVCYYLKSHGLKVRTRPHALTLWLRRWPVWWLTYAAAAGVQVMIAACDTFRSGAVEQLKVHARCLEVRGCSRLARAVHVWWSL